MGWVILQQLAAKNRPHRYAKRLIWLKQLLNQGSVFPHDFNGVTLTKPSQSTAGCLFSLEAVMTVFWTIVWLQFPSPSISSTSRALSVAWCSVSLLNPCSQNSPTQEPSRVNLMILRLITGLRVLQCYLSHSLPELSSNKALHFPESFCPLVSEK